jgi:uncharacterized protein
MSAPVVAAGVVSPCINVCRMEAHTGLCGGCQRTIDEIVAWSRMDDAAKRDVWSRIEVRRAAVGGEAAP